MTPYNEFHYFGFSSIKSFLIKVMGMETSPIISAKLAGGLAIGMISFVENWIWKPADTLVIYFLVLGADYLSGMYVGVKIRKEGFQTAKAMRIVPICLAHLIILGFLFNFGRINKSLGVPGIDTMFFALIGRMFYFYTILINFASFLKNASVAKLIKGKTAEWFIRNVDRYKNAALMYGKPEEPDVQEAPAGEIPNH